MVEVAHFASVFRCKAGSFPSMYLGMPLSIGILKKSPWEPVITRFDKKLSLWKCRYLSFGGRITIMKSVLASLPVYFLSCFRCSRFVIQE